MVEYGNLTVFVAIHYCHIKIFLRHFYNIKH